MAKHSHFGNQSSDFHGQLLLWKNLSVLKRVIIKLQSGWMWRKNCRNHRWDKPCELNILGLKFIQILLTGYFKCSNHQDSIQTPYLTQHHSTGITFFMQNEASVLVQCGHMAPQGIQGFPPPWQGRASCSFVSPGKLLAITIWISEKLCNIAKCNPC